MCWRFWHWFYFLDENTVEYVSKKRKPVVYIINETENGSNNSIEELIIRYLQNEIQEDELRVLDAWIHESDANKAHFFELKGLFDTRKEVAFLNHYSVERSWERMAGKLDAISGVSVKSKVLGKQFWLSFLRYAAIIVIAMGIGVGMNQWISNRLYAGDMEYNEIVVEKADVRTRYCYPTAVRSYSMPPPVLNTPPLLMEMSVWFIWRVRPISRLRRIIRNLSS